MPKLLFKKMLSFKTMSNKELAPSTTNELDDTCDVSMSLDLSTDHETTQFDDLVLTKILNKAKFTVALGHLPSQKKEVAVKLFPFESNKPDVSFLNEIAFANLKHENVIQVLHYQEQQDIAFINTNKTASYIIMELAPYGDLYEIIDSKRNRLNQKLARTFFQQILNGLDYLHSIGIAHLDLKLENLLLGSDYKLKICDFEQSYKKDHSFIMSRGSEDYRAPEIVHENCQDPYAADIYSAGVILFILASQGFIPYSETEKFQGVDMFKVMMTNPDFFWKKACEVQKKDASFFSEDFKALFMSMVAYDPKKRPTVEEVMKSRWYAGDVYSHDELEKILKLSL